MARNVLLLLSSNQPPPPEDEVEHHAARCAAGAVAAFVTTRRLRGLTPGESVVAFHGGATLNNRYLGRGVFERLLPLDSPVRRAVLAEDPLYAKRGAPANARAIVLLRGVRVAARGEGLEALGGTIEATGLPLTLTNLPRGPARVQVYYT